MTNLDFSKKFITTNNIKEIASIAVIYGLIMFYLFFSASKYGFEVTLKSSTFLEIAITGLIFFAYAFFSTLILIYKYYSSCKISVIYGRVTLVLIFAIYLLFTFEVFDFYWIELRKNSKYWSYIFSGLFFTPIVVFLWEILQKIFFFIFGTGWLDPNESPTIQDIIKNEVSKQLHNEKQYSIRKTYNEKNQLISTSYYEKIEDGHWLCVKTSVNLEAGAETTFYAEHIRTHENFEKYGYQSSVASEKSINSEKIFKSNNSSSFRKCSKFRK